MTKKHWNRSIHIAGLVLCLLAIYLSAGAAAEMKSAITLAVAGLGMAGNAYGIWRPYTWFR